MTGGISDTEFGSGRVIGIETGHGHQTEVKFDEFEREHGGKNRTLGRYRVQAVVVEGGGTQAALGR